MSLITMFLEPEIRNLQKIRVLNLIRNCERDKNGIFLRQNRGPNPGENIQRKDRAMRNAKIIILTIFYDTLYLSLLIFRIYWY